jgi:protease I
MQNRLNGKRIAILATDGFEQSELTSPKQAIENAGGKADIVSPVDGDKVKGWQHGDWGDELPVDVKLDAANPGDYDGLMLPGGVMNPDSLRVNEKALAFVRWFFENGKPVAAICHGPWTLINAGVAEGREARPSRSRRSMKISPPWSRRRRTHPIRQTSRPISAAVRSPQ